MIKEKKGVVYKKPCRTFMEPQRIREEAPKRRKKA